MTSPESLRNVRRCPHCNLIQYVLSTALCRRCRKSLYTAAAPKRIEEVIAASTLSCSRANNTPPPVAHVIPDSGFATAQRPRRRRATSIYCERIGRVIRAVRHKRGFTQRALAQESGINLTLLSKIERGETIPTIPTLERLLPFLGTSVSAVFASIGRNQELQVRPSRTADVAYSPFVGSVLSALRARRHMTQPQVAALVGIPRTHIVKIEHGRIVPFISTLEGIAAALGSDLAGIFLTIDQLQRIPAAKAVSLVA
jgi:transcriptional regulator with XRE-family HTH domain